MPFGEFYRSRRVLVTGDTGFKGAWLCSWLKALGAEVYGLGLAPNTSPALFDVLKLGDDLRHSTVDIRNPAALAEAVAQVRPDVVFHLAAQALVRASYEEPLLTFSTNVMGTAHLLAAIQSAGYTPQQPCAVVVVTSDKCYENRESYYGYREEDSLGGHDVYSASKGCAELVVSAWRRSFFATGSGTPAVRLASCRAGNVIGGGDWSADRIVVDSIRSLSRGEAIPVRNPNSIRPWQHVLESLSGYLRVGEAVMNGEEGARFCTSWNFGPGHGSERSVRELCDALVRHWGSGSWEHRQEKTTKHEACYLKLAIDKAWHHLGWQPVWDFEDAIRQTVAWYRAAHETGCDPARMRELTAAQIASFVASGAKKGLTWAR